MNNYWQKRCEAAEALINKYASRIPDSPEYMNWQSALGEATPSRPDLLPPFSQYIINMINDYQQMRDGWKDNTPNFCTYDLLVRELRKVAEKYLELEVYSEATPAPGQKMYVEVDASKELPPRLNNFEYSDFVFCTFSEGGNIINESGYFDYRLLSWYCSGVNVKVKSWLKPYTPPAGAAVTEEGWVSVESGLPDKDKLIAVWQNNLSDEDCSRFQRAYFTDDIFFIYPKIGGSSGFKKSNNWEGYDMEGDLCKITHWRYVKKPN